MGMRHYNAEQEKEMLAFATEAAEVFSKNTECVTFTRNGAVSTGELFAVRWGLCDDCVLVFRVDPGTEPTLYPGMVKKCP